ncbi:hypothetical protein SGFS_055460 [Streptomyces graminofaciens]|uniref:Serine/threonine protein kinase n=1 Tax=Streptomyces graminofaciens TaxID=68212 RepID=A0ABM7FD52_9ACTN|nr:hypothetical protein [Streptomyces graminofaciens]BBC34252.1 hypothetical protein SGFS_055460 [Streptomyces graminofaciens]
MSTYGPTPTPPPRPGPPGPPGPNPGPGNGQRIAVISLIVTSALSLIGIGVTWLADRDPDTGPEPKPNTSPTGPTTTRRDDPEPPKPDPSTPSTEVTVVDDGLTDAQRDLRDSLNEDQWQRGSCEPDTTTIPGARAGLLCTVTVQDPTYGAITGKANIALYKSQAEMRSVFKTYTGGLPDGNCDDGVGVHGLWNENDSTTPGGDVACYTNTRMQYVIACTYYERPALLVIMGPDYNSLLTWWHNLEPVFKN